MCGGPVRKAMGGVMKSVAPKSVAKSVASAKQLPTPEIASKPRVQPLPPKDVRTIGGEPRRSDEGISAKQRLAGTAGDYAAPPEKAKTMGGEPKTPKGAGRELPRPEMAPKDVRTIGGEPKAPKDVAGPAWMRAAQAAQTMGGASRDAKTIGGAPKAPKGGMTMGKSPTDGLTKSPMDRAAPTGPLGSVAKNPPKGGAALSKMAQSVAKGVSSVNTAKRGVPVASNKPMIGRYKTGGYVSKSSFKW